jgi:hypothetical protein
MNGSELITRIYFDKIYKCMKARSFSNTSVVSRSRAESFKYAEPRNQAIWTTLCFESAPPSWLSQPHPPESKRWHQPYAELCYVDSLSGGVYEAEDVVKDVVCIISRL